MNEFYDHRVVELVFAVGNTTSEYGARERVNQRIDIACNRDFMPALMQTRERLLQWRDAPPDVDQVIALTLSTVRSILLERTPTEIGLGGICTAMLTSNAREKLVGDVEHFHSFVGDPFFDEWDAVTREFEARGLDELANRVRAQGDAIAFLALAPKLDHLMQSLRIVVSARDGIEHISDLAQTTGYWIVRGCRTIEGMARGSGDTADRPQSDLILTQALIFARERFDAGASREAIVEELLDDQDVKSFVRIQRARTESVLSKQELTQIAACINPQFGSSIRFVLADGEDAAWHVLEDEPGLFSRQAEREFSESADLFRAQGRADMAERFQLAATRVRRWRDELIDSQCNFLVRLGTRVTAKEVTLDQALAELNQPGALDGLSVSHLGALDEKIISLCSADELAQAEILAVLNHTAAQKVGTPKMIAYADLSLSEIWLARGESAEKIIARLKEADTIAQKIGDARMQVRAVGTLGMVYQQITQFQEALQAYQRAWMIAREEDLLDAEIAARDNLLSVYALIGDVKHAEEMARQALELAQKRKDRESEYHVLAQLANVLYKAGRTHESIGYYEKALRIAREFGDLFVEANILSNLGQAYTDTGNYGSAEDYMKQTLAWAEKSQNLRLEGVGLAGLGRIQFRRAQMEEGRHHSEEARRYFQDALQYFEKSLQRMRLVENPDGQATMLNNVARVEVALGQYAQAEKHYRASIEQMEGVRIGVIGESERIAFMGFDRVHAYTGLVKLLVLPACQHLREAWETVERSRSRAFVEQLALTPLLVGTRVDSKAQAQEYRLLAQVRVRTEVLRREQNLTVIDLQARLLAANALAQAERELEKFWDTNEIPAEYVELRKGDPITFPELQRLLI